MADYYGPYDLLDSTFLLNTDPHAWNGGSLCSTQFYKDEDPWFPKQYQFTSIEDAYIPPGQSDTISTLPHEAFRGVDPTEVEFSYPLQSTIPIHTTASWGATIPQAGTTTTSTDSSTYSSTIGDTSRHSSTNKPFPPAPINEIPSVSVIEASANSPTPIDSLLRPAPLHPSGCPRPPTVDVVQRLGGVKRKAVDVVSEASYSTSEYEDSGAESEDSDDYVLPPVSRTIKTRKKHIPSKDDDGTSVKSVGPAPKRLKLENGEAQRVDPLGPFICGLIIKYKGKGSQYTMKGLETPEVGDVCKMRCINQTDMNRHREKTLWHCDPENLWTCNFCGKVMNSRVDNQTRHGPKCKGTIESEDEGANKKKFKAVTKKTVRKGKGRAH